MLRAHRPGCHLRARGGAERAAAADRGRRAPSVRPMAILGDSKLLIALAAGGAGLDATSVRVAELNGQPLETVAATAPSMSDLPVLQGPHAPAAPAHAPAPVALPVLPSSPVVDQALPVIPVDDGRMRTRAILMKVGAPLITNAPNAAASKGRAQGPIQSVNAVLCIEGFVHGAGPLPSGQPVHVLGEKAHVTVNAIPRVQVLVHHRKVPQQPWVT